MDTTSALLALGGLAHDTRLRVFRLLVQAGPDGLSAGDIGEHLGVRQNTMSSHLKQLVQAGLIDSERQGRSIFYAASYSTVRALVLFLMQDCCAGSREVCGPVVATLAVADR